MELLIHKGANANYKNKVRQLYLSFIMTLSIYLQIGFTPLHYASKNGHTDVVEMLIDHDSHIDVSSEVQEWVSLSDMHVMCHT